jgi:hypothetical protein
MGNVMEHDPTKQPLNTKQLITYLLPYKGGANYTAMHLNGDSALTLAVNMQSEIRKLMDTIRALRLTPAPLEHFDKTWWDARIKELSDDIEP